MSAAEVANTTVKAANQAPGADRSADIGVGFPIVSDEVVTGSSAAPPLPVNVLNFIPVEMPITNTDEIEAVPPADHNHLLQLVSIASPALHEDEEADTKESTSKPQKIISTDGPDQHEAAQPQKQGLSQGKSGQQFGHALSQLRRTFTVSTKKSPKAALPGQIGEMSLKHSKSLDEADSSNLPAMDSSKRLTPSNASALARGFTSTFQYVVKQVQKGTNIKKVPKEQQQETSLTTDGAAPKEIARMGAVTQQGSRLIVEDFHDVDDVIKIGEKEPLTMGTAVLITKCSNAKFEVVKKCNKIELDSSQKITVTLPSVISSVDVQRCDGCEVFCRTGCPGINLDSLHSCRIHIPESAVESVHIASSGGGSASVVVTREEEAGELDETPIPFSFVHTFKEGKLVSEASPLYTH